MKNKILFTTTIASWFALGFLVWCLWPEPPAPAIPPPAAFMQLPGWQTSQVKPSLLAFRESCTVFLKKHPEHAAGSQLIDLKAKDWQPACHAAEAITSISNRSAKTFFETWFTPVAFYNHKPLHGLFTGYFMPVVHGSLVKTKQYAVPVYGLPSRKKSELRYTRAQINQGALAHKAPVILWVNSQIDRLFLEIEGAGSVKLPNGKLVHLGYAGENGAPYTPIARLLINKGVMTKDNASSKHIKRYMKAHPREADALLNQNKSFVFFQKLKHNAAIGAQGFGLTAGYSLAVDRKWVPLGAPLWLNTTHPNEKNRPFQRLMIAQDTGGAIKGAVRGDIFYGSGKDAIYAAENMQNQGSYWLLLPKQAISRIKNNFSHKTKTLSATMRLC